MPIRRPTCFAALPLIASALVAALVFAAPPAPAQGLFDQIQDLGKKIQKAVPKNERPGTPATTATTSPRNGGVSGGPGGGGGISPERRAAMALQQGLNDLGFDAGTVDGLPGAQTRAAIGRFQAARGFDVTGALTPAQRRVFDTDVARVAGDRATVEIAEIAEMQAYLGALGYSVGTPDGAYGPRTAAALDAFRRDMGLPGGAGPTLTDAASLYARVHGVAPAARPAGPVLLAAPAPGLSAPSNLSAQTAPVAAASAAAPGPSFDCALALSDAERAICADPRLGTLDRQLADAWRAAAATGTPAAEQRAWLTERNACGTDAACLADRMQARLGVLTGTGTSIAAVASATPAAPPPPVATPVTEADRVHLLRNGVLSQPDGLDRRLMLLRFKANPDELMNSNQVMNLYIQDRAAATGQPRHLVQREFMDLNLIQREDLLRAKRDALQAEAAQVPSISPDTPLPVAFYIPARPAAFEDGRGLSITPDQGNFNTSISGLMLAVSIQSVPGIGHVPMDRAAASALLDRIALEERSSKQLMRIFWGRITSAEAVVNSVMSGRFELDRVTLDLVDPRGPNQNNPGWVVPRPDGGLHAWQPPAPKPAAPVADAASVKVAENRVLDMPEGFARRLTLAALRAAPALLENLSSVKPFFIADRIVETGESEQAVNQQFYALNTLEQEDLLRAKRTALRDEARGVTGFDTAPESISFYLPSQFSGTFDASKGLEIRGGMMPQISLGAAAPGLVSLPVIFDGLPDLAHMPVTRDTAKGLLDRQGEEAARGAELHRVVRGRITGIRSDGQYGRAQVVVTVDSVTAHFLPRFRPGTDASLATAPADAALFTWQPAPVLDDPVDAGPDAPLVSRLKAIDPVRSERLLAEAIMLQGGGDALYAEVAERFQEVQGANEFDKPGARAAAIETLKTAGDGPIWIEGSTALGQYDLDSETFALQPSYLRWRVNGVGVDVQWRFALVGPDPFTALPVPPEIARPIVESGNRRDVRFLMRVEPMSVNAANQYNRLQYDLALRPEEVIFYRDGDRDPQTRLPARDPLAARDFAAENAALDERLSRRFEASAFDGLADLTPGLSAHVLDLIAVRAAGEAPRDAAALADMMLAAWNARQADPLPGPDFFADDAAAPARGDSTAPLHPSFRSWLEAKAAALGERFTTRLYVDSPPQQTCVQPMRADRFYTQGTGAHRLFESRGYATGIEETRQALRRAEAPMAVGLRLGMVGRRESVLSDGACIRWTALLALRDAIHEPYTAQPAAVHILFEVTAATSFPGQSPVPDMLVEGMVLETRLVARDGSVGDPLVVPEPELEPEPEPQPVAAAAPAPGAAAAAVPAPVPAPATPRADPAAAQADWPAPDAMAPALSGIDLLGLRTGMSLAEADATLRGAQDGIIGIFETPAPPASAAADGPGPLDYRRVYLLRDGQEAVTLASYAPGGPVLAVMRRLVLDQGTLPYDRIEAALVDKYGDPAMRIDGVGLQGWGPAEGQHCFALPLEGYGVMLAPVPGMKSDGLDPMDFPAAQMSLGSLPASERRMLTVCGPVLVYLAEQPETWGASGFSATLIDQTAMAQATEALTPAPETVEIEIEF